jgi:outer membrane protein TolC
MLDCDWSSDVCSSDLTYSWTQNNVGFNTDPTFWQFVVTADWVLWDGGFRLANGQKSASQLRQARLAEEKAQDDAGEAVRTLWSTRQKATASLDTAEHEAALAEENLRIAEVAFGAGGVSFLELEDARLGLIASKMSVLSERMQRDLATIDLLAATGDL